MDPTRGLESDETRPKVEALTQEEINERLRRKRKARGQKACHPCRQRKVGCNYQKPCQKCIDRNHPELCVYEPVSKRANIDTSATTHQVPAPASTEGAPVGWSRITERLQTIEQSIQELRTELKDLAGRDGSPSTLVGRPRPDRAGRDSSSDGVDQDSFAIHTSNEVTGETVHLGGNSVPAMVFSLKSDPNEYDVQDLLGKSILPLFGLDNESATYPFVDLWGLPHGSYARLQALCRLLPTDADCLQYFAQYRDTAHVLFPGVVDIKQFEGELTHFLINKAAVTRDAPYEALSNDNIYGKTLHWVGLLFAILASGYQCSSLPRKERQLTSQVYVCCAYECLRIINYLSNSKLLDIQTLLVLGNVISNNMNSGIAWCLLGLTIRIGQSLGLHQKAFRTSSDAERSVREELWWRIVWQDSLISITFDRASATPTISHHKTIESAENVWLSYTDCMKILCETGLDIVRERSKHSDPRHELVRIKRHQDELARMMSHSLQHLKDATACQSMRDQLEHWNLYLHRSYIMCELYRSALKRKGASSELAPFRAICLENMANTVDAFLGLSNVTRFATQSWAAVHRSLSSALLLGILKQPQTDLRVRSLLDKLIMLMSSINSSLDPTEISAPISRAVRALARLNAFHGSDAGAEHGAGGHVVPGWDRSTSSDVHMYSGHPSNEASGDDAGRSEDSPYELMEKILWGSQGISPV
ncbi:Fungal specific transcription factor domain-containing protein isoform 2 [Cladophialophora immunda]|nr:Fungal specific transcription factor domain-containing protein isoform 2 [Cladophialophora immunda]